MTLFLTHSDNLGDGASLGWAIRTWDCHWKTFVCVCVCRGSVLMVVSAAETGQMRQKQRVCVEKCVCVCFLLSVSES